MKKKEKKKLTIDEYIDIAKWDIVIYVIVSVIVLLICYCTFNILIYWC